MVFLRHCKLKPKEVDHLPFPHCFATLSFEDVWILRAGLYSLCVEILCSCELRSAWWAGPWVLPKCSGWTMRAKSSKTSARCSHLSLAFSAGKLRQVMDGLGRKLDSRHSLDSDRRGALATGVAGSRDNGAPETAFDFLLPKPPHSSQWTAGFSSSGRHPDLSRSHCCWLLHVSEQSAANGCMVYAAVSVRCDHFRFEYAGALPRCPICGTLWSTVWRTQHAAISFANPPGGSQPWTEATEREHDPDSGDSE